MKGKAITYRRVSTAEQREHGFSLRQQAEALRAWCAAEGYEILAEIKDAGQSGAHLERPGLDRVRDMVEAGDVDVVVAQDADRVTRDPIHRGFLDRDMARHGTRLVALDDWGDDSHQGELLRYMRGWVAKGERLEITERTRRGINRKAREGYVIRGRKAPYGFRYADNGDDLFVDEEQMVVVRRIFRLLGIEGETAGSLVKRLTSEGVPSPTGGNWHRPTLRFLVLNELYLPLTASEAAAHVSEQVAATLVEGEPYELWTFNKKRQEKRRERDEVAPGGYRDRYVTTHRPREEWVFVPVSLKGAGLIREHVEVARERAKDRKKRPPSVVRQREWLLSGGLARCAECSSSLTPLWARRRKGGFRFYYNCRQRYSNGPRDCPNTRTPRAEELEEAVWKAVRRMLSDPDRVLREFDAYIERRKKALRGDPGRETRDLEGRLRKLDQRRSGYFRLAADDFMDRDELRQKLAEVDKAREGLRGALEEARRRHETLSRLQRDREVLRRRFSTLYAMDLRHVGPEGRRRILQALRLRAEMDRKGDVRISGVLNTDISSVLPMDQAPLDESRVVHFRREVLPSYRGEVTLDTTPIVECSRSPTMS